MPTLCMQMTNARNPTTNPLVGRLADLIADIVEADGSHPWDGGFSEQLRQDGLTVAGKRRLIEEMRQRALREINDAAE